MKISELPKIFCSCGSKMFPNENRDDPSEAESGPALVKIYIFGRLSHELAGIWYACNNPDCDRSVTVIPDFPNTRPEGAAEILYEEPTS